MEEREFCILGDVCAFDFYDAKLTAPQIVSKLEIMRRMLTAIGRISSVSGSWQMLVIIVFSVAVLVSWIRNTRKMLEPV